MTEVALALAGALNGLFFYLIAKHGADERRRFLAAVMAKDPGEFVALDRATSAPKPKKQKVLPPRHPIGL